MEMGNERSRTPETETPPPEKLLGATAAQLIVDVTHKLDSSCLDPPKFIPGDFNHCMIDLCYASVGSAYKALPVCPITTVFLVPEY